MSEKIKLFVYGTLRSGAYNHRVMKELGGILESAAKTASKYAMYVGQGLPFVTDAEQLSHIHGEVYEISPEALARLDRFESHPKWYTRKMVAVVKENGEPTTAWLYFNANPQGVLVQSGDYMKQE